MKKFKIYAIALSSICSITLFASYKPRLYLAQRSPVTQTQEDFEIEKAMKHNLTRMRICFPKNPSEPTIIATRKSLLPASSSSSSYAPPSAPRPTRPELRPTGTKIKIHDTELELYAWHPCEPNEIKIKTVEVFYYNEKRDK